MTFKLVPGRWVKFDGDFDGAFHARDGRVVGIYTVDEEGRPYIAVVDPDGANLFLPIGDKSYPVQVTVQQNKLAPITDRRDIPPKRIAHLPADWQPRQEHGING